MALFVGERHSWLRSLSLRLPSFPGGESPQNVRHTLLRPSRNDLPLSTYWHRVHGRPSRQDTAAKRQYLTPSEEKALVDYALRLAARGYPVPVKFLRYLAQWIVRQRSSSFQVVNVGTRLCRLACLGPASLSPLRMLTGSTQLHTQVLGHIVLPIDPIHSNSLWLSASWLTAPSHPSL
jgi:hypothetical protein